MRYKEYKEGGKTSGDKKVYAYNYYLKKGVPVIQAAGIVGNLATESGFDTTVVGKADSKQSQGIGQWHSERLNGLKKFAGSNWTTLDSQLDYVLHELNTTEKKAKNSLFSARTPQEASLAFMNDYERPAEWAKKQSGSRRVNESLKLMGLKPDPNYSYGSEQEDIYRFSEYKKTDYYAPQISENIISLDNTQETTNLAEDKATEIKNRLEQKKAEKALLQQMILATQVAYVNPADYQSQPTFEEPQQEQMFQEGGISQFKKKPFKLQIERNNSIRDNTPNTKRDLSLMLTEQNNINKDKQELQTTGQIKNPNSIHYKRNVKVQPQLRQDNISTEQRNTQLSPLERPLIYLANPSKILGDIGVPNMETSELDRQAIASNRFNSNQSRADRFINQAKLGLGYVPEAAVNTAMAAAFMPEGSGALGLVNEALNPLAGLKTSIPDSMKEGLNSQGFLDMFKSKPFKTEINWNNWNKEISNNTDLLNEYHTIEQTSKANKTWMKNPDGSKFQGTPEQFVQQNSKNFKKAFKSSKLVNSDGTPTIVYHGSPEKFEVFDKFQVTDQGFHGKGVYTTTNKNYAQRYAGDVSDKNPTPTLYELYGSTTNPATTGEFREGLYEFNKGIDVEKNFLNYDSAVENLNYKSGEENFPIYKAREIVFPKSNQVKSAIGNNGMFDMTNPNIYKSIVPIAGASYLATQQEEFKNGGEKNSLWKNIRANKGSGKKPTKEMLEQERKINRKEDGGVIEDDRGQWAFPGEITKISSGNITMEGVDYPVYGIDNLGNSQMMYPGQNYQFPGTSVTEYPQTKARIKTKRFSK